MTTLDTKIPPDWADIAAETERRNGTIELHCVGDQSERSGTARSRLLRIEGNGQWLIEKPYVMHGPKLSRGNDVMGVVGEGPKRLSFVATVAGTELFQLNREKRVAVVRLSPPRHIQSAQRRAYYRVSAIGANVPLVQLWPVEDAAAMIPIEKACHAMHGGANVPAEYPPDGSDMHGELFDISGNGLSLLIDPRFHEVLKQTPLFLMQLQLPGVNHPYWFVARRIRLRQDQGTVIRAAFTFEFAHHPAYQRFLTDAICQFTTNHQRLQLKRTR